MKENYLFIENRDCDRETKKEGEGKKDIQQQRKIGTCVHLCVYLCVHVCVCS